MLDGGSITFVTAGLSAIWFVLVREVGTLFCMVFDLRRLKLVFPFRCFACSRLLQKCLEKKCFLEVFCISQTTRQSVEMDALEETLSLEAVCISKKQGIVFSLGTVWRKLRTLQYGAYIVFPVGESDFLRGKGKDSACGASQMV